MASEASRGTSRGVFERAPTGEIYDPPGLRGKPDAYEQALPRSPACPERVPRAGRRCRSDEKLSVAGLPLPVTGDPLEI